MTGFDAKAPLHEYLRGARETLIWKLDGLGEYDPGVAAMDGRGCRRERGDVGHAG
jgi:hypothetical protein